MPDHPVTSLRKSLKARFRGASDNSGSVTPTAAQGSSVAALPFTIQSSNVTSVPSSQKPAISTAVSVDPDIYVRGPWSPDYGYTGFTKLNCLAYVPKE
jgi:hypothetical protein